MKKFLSILVLLAFFGCEKEKDIVTYKINCDNRYYIKYYDNNSDRFISTDTIKGNWEIDLKAHYNKEHVIKIYTFDTIPSTGTINIYLNDIYQGGTTFNQDSTSKRFALMIR